MAIAACEGRVRLKGVADQAATESRSQAPLPSDSRAVSAKACAIELTARSEGVVDATCAGPADFQPDPQPGSLPGKHLILEMYGATGLDDRKLIEQAMRSAVANAGATLLDFRMHVFTPSGGVTGTASLAESHMSIHTWPEHGYVALDIFMCGECDPRSCLPELIRAFAPTRMEVIQLLRGTDLAAAITKPN
jgi:S-adenosylmethionine decarboxylase